jgi:purine nucleoside permease
MGAVLARDSGALVVQENRVIVLREQARLPQGRGNSGGLHHRLKRANRNAGRSLQQKSAESIGAVVARNTFKKWLVDDWSVLL